MPLNVPVAHDFICPWCWVALDQARRLEAEFDVTFEWRGYELFPEDMEWPDREPDSETSNKPATPSRFDFMLAAEGLVMPDVQKPHKMRSFRAHRAVEHVRAEGGDADGLMKALYAAFYDRGANIDELPVLLDLAGGFTHDASLMEAAIERRDYSDKIVEYDDPAYATGVWNVPTFFIGDERLAEQPTIRLREALLRAGARRREVSFPEGPEERPYVVIDMVQTIDGKTVAGEEHGTKSLTSKEDQALMREIQRGTDAVLVGAATLRASDDWDPEPPVRIVVTGSGSVPYDAPYLANGEAIVVGPPSLPDGARATLIPGPVEWTSLLKTLRNRGIGRLCVLGGSEINAGLLGADLVDEIFVTVAPKIGLGRGRPTYAGGEPLEVPLGFTLVSERPSGDEVYLRYRRAG